MSKLFLVFLMFVFNISANAEMLKNEMKNHASLYLAMHGNDPVAWQEWNQETINRAKKEDKLIFVSSGYFSCHWCHVMQRESYNNSQVAGIINKYFIPVKVDREINSALDSRLIDFVERTQGHSGWPLNAFVTPDGYPLLGMTYVPTKNFIEVLTKLKIKWQEEKSLLNNVAKNATAEIEASNIEKKELDKGLGYDYLSRFISHANEMADVLAGGFGQQNKFPSYPQLSVLLTAYKNKPETNLKQFILLSLNKMASQGLNDQLSGGFFRYSVDPNWQIPHFEKMLYDNALLASLYIDAAIVFPETNYEQVAKNTLDFLQNYFESEQGAFISSFSALDDKGIEGGYYLWQVDELRDILNSTELKIVKLIWNLEGTAELENGHHFVEARSVKEVADILKLPESNINALFLSAKKKLLDKRKNRKIPRDDKLLAGWNGLALSAFSKAAIHFNNKSYENTAKNIKKYIKANLWENSKLVIAKKNNRVLGEATISDYSYIAQGLSDWIELSKNKKDTLWLDEIISQSWKRFYTKRGWQLSENSLLKYGQAEAVIADGVLPSASAMLIDLSLRLAEKNNDIKLKNKAVSALKIGHSEILNQPFWYATQIDALYTYLKEAK